MNATTVRQAVLADLEELTVMFDGYRQFYGRTSDLDAARSFLRNRFEHGESVIFIACRANEAVGFAQLYPSFSSVSVARTFILNDLFVHPACRNAGIGNSLIQAATQYAKSVGAIRLSLSTASTNKTAQVVYETAGWRRNDEYYTYECTV